MKKPLIIGGLGVLLIALGALTLGGRDPLRSDARRAWKDKAILEISDRLADSAWLRLELQHLKTRGAAAASGSDGWLSDRLILMRNGEWLAYASICRKEDQDGIQDLFLACGSDGRWYYSTYHFCVRMIGLGVEEQSADLIEFVKAYSLRPFDGRSDECLQRTWPQNLR